MIKILPLILAAAVLAGCSTPPRTEPVTSSPREENPHFTGTPLVWNSDAENKFAHATQDRVNYETHSNTLTFNGEKIHPDALAKKLEHSHALTFSCHSTLPVESLQPMLDLLRIIGQSPVDPKRVMLHCMGSETTTPPNDLIRILKDGSLTLNGIPIQLSELPRSLSTSRAIGIQDDATRNPLYPRIQEILAATEPFHIEHVFFENRSLMIEIIAEIYQLNEDGSNTVLSAPSVSTRLNGRSTIRMVANRSGFKGPFFPRQDPYSQKDLAHCGVRFSVTADVIGDHTRISGVMVLVRETDRKESFTLGETPIYGYSARKTVAPFSVVQPPGIDYVEFETAAVDGKKTWVRLKATPTDAAVEPFAPPENKPEIASLAEAARLLEKDPYSKKALKAVLYYTNLERDQERQKRNADYHGCELLKSPRAASSTGNQHLPTQIFASIPGDPDLRDHIHAVLHAHGINAQSSGSMSYQIEAPDSDRTQAKGILQKDAELHGYAVDFRTE